MLNFPLRGECSTPNANAARLAFFTQKRYIIGKEDKKMTTDVLNKEI